MVKEKEVKKVEGKCLKCDVTLTEANEGVGKLCKKCYKVNDE